MSAEIIDLTQTSSENEDIDEERWAKRPRLVSDVSPELPKNESGIYLTRLPGDKSQTTFEMSLKDILRGSEEEGGTELHAMVQINFMVDLDFLVESMPHDSFHKTAILVIHGMHNEEQFRHLTSIQQTRYPNIRLFRPTMPFNYGTHHTKAMILFYRGGSQVRIVVHTANLIRQDWALKTQAAWISPLLPLKSSIGDHEVYGCEFERDLIEYLKHYGNIVASLISNLRRFDFRSCKCSLITSIPGRYGNNNDLYKHGHMKLRKLLSTCENYENKSETGEEREFYKDEVMIFQSSSIGSMGNSMGSWWSGEMKDSFTSSSQQNFPSNQIHLIYPTVENVQNSLEGYEAGASLPYDFSNWSKQKGFMQSHMSQWQASNCGRTRAMPHIKSYTIANQMTGRMRYFVLTSANMSKAAWGMLEKKQTQLFVRNYEMGVLLLPEYFSETSDAESLPACLICRQFCDRTTESGECINIMIPVPYDLPLTPYSSTDEAWTWNQKHNEPDMFGRSWP